LATVQGEPRPHTESAVGARATGAQKNQPESLNESAASDQVCEHLDIVKTILPKQIVPGQPLVWQIDLEMRMYLPNGALARCKYELVHQKVCSVP
jgi:hypothetical protein